MWQFLERFTNKIIMFSMMCIFNKRLIYTWFSIKQYFSWNGTETRNRIWFNQVFSGILVRFWFGSFRIRNDTVSRIKTGLEPKLCKYQFGWVLLCENIQKWPKQNPKKITVVSVKYIQIDPNFTKYLIQIYSNLSKLQKNECSD